MSEDFPGAEFYDCLSVPLIMCTWPGCGWADSSATWDEDMHRGFVEHFQATHTAAPVAPGGQ